MNLSQCLYLFNHIISHGDLRQGKHHYGELAAWAEVDGYTCYIEYKDLTLTLMFHSRLSYDYKERSTYKEFLSLVERKYLELKAR